MHVWLARGIGCAFIALTLKASVLAAADWQPASGPLMTRWAKEVTPDRVWPEYPRPQMVRKDWQNLNGLWQLAFARAGEEPPIGKNLPEKILVPFPVESALSGVMKRADRLWYRRTFTLPDAWKDRRVLLHFGAVDWEARVWVNGKPVGEHRGGYDPFTFDVTDVLKPAGDQELIVGVYDPTDAGTQPRGKQVNKPGGIYYEPSTGIWQTVWLEPVPKKNHVAGLRITPDLDSGKVELQVRMASPGNGLRLQVTAGGATHVFQQPGREADKFTITFPVRDPRPWSPEDPHLYPLILEVGPSGEPAGDRIESYFAFRRIEVGPDEKGITRILLNGKPYFQVGPLDQGFWPDGLYTPPTDAAMRHDVDVTKRLGFNVIRKHVKVEPARWYSYCDKVGILVWQDMPSGDKSVAYGRGEITRTPEAAKQFELELQRMIDALRNHPCIVTWVVFNEGWGQYDTRRITEWAKKYDPTRLVIGASGWNDVQCGDLHDIHVYPGPGSPNPEPKRAAVLGEFGGLGLKIDGHTWTKETWGYRGTADRDDLTRKYERLLRRVYELKEKPGLSAAIYTQTTDVETEANGLLTYDRAVLKVDEKRVAAVNRGDFSNVPVTRVVVPTSQEAGIPWRYVFAKPADDWFKNDFDDSKWSEGPGGFGTRGTPGAVVRTEWKTPDVWLRREFTLPEVSVQNLLLFLHHDEDVEVYLNGVLAAKLSGYGTGYEEAPISAEALATLKPGKNRFAVHCRQTGGGQYVDLGLVEVKLPQGKPER